MTTPNESVLCFNGFNKKGVSTNAGLLTWVERFWAVRGLGGSVDAMLVALGKADVWIEPNAKPWDFAPLKILVEKPAAASAHSTARTQSTKATVTPAPPRSSRISLISSKTSADRFPGARNPHYRYNVAWSHNSANHGDWCIRRQIFARCRHTYLWSSGLLWRPG